MEIEETIRECAANAYRVPVGQITMSTDLRSDLSPKSMNMLAFVSGVENELDVAIPMSLVGSLKTVQDFVDKVRELSRVE